MFELQKSDFRFWFQANSEPKHYVQEARKRILPSPGAAPCNRYKHKTSDDIFRDLFFDERSNNLICWLFSIFLLLCPITFQEIGFIKPDNLKSSYINLDLFCDCQNNYSKHFCSFLAFQTSSNSPKAGCSFFKDRDSPKPPQESSSSHHRRANPSGIYFIS